MSLWRQFVRGLRALANPKAADRDIDDEVAHYLDEAASNFEEGGLSPDEARRAARLEVGDRVAVREAVREHGWENAIEGLVADVRYGTRRLRHSPAFTAVGAFTLALGIGASTAIFSVVYPVLLQPLPYADAGRLIMIWDRQKGTRLDVTFGTFRELQQRSRSLESIAVMRPLQSTLTGIGEPERLDGQFVSADYFRVLGVRPALGRDFESSDDRPRAPFVAILSDALWRRRYEADPAIIGRQILLDDNPVTVVGILPASFENVLSPSAEIWSTLQYDPSLPVNGREWGHHLQMVGRLRNDVRLGQATLELETIAGTKLAEFPRPQWASVDDGFIISRLQDDLTRSVKPVLFALLGAVALLLAIACVNVTNLLIARGAQRRTELSVRAALGASRLRLIRQLFVETFLLAAVGGLLGIVLAHAAVDALVALSPAELPRAGAIGVDGPVLAFAFALTTLLGLAIGMVPALHGAGASLQEGMQQRSMRIAGGHHVTRRSLVVVQVAFAVVLLIGAGLLLRSVQHLFAVPPGFDPTSVLTMQVQAAGARYRDATATHQFFEQALEAVRKVPGVSAAAFTSQLPLTGGEDVWGVQVETTPGADAEGGRDGYRYAVSPGYFEAMRIPLRAGRLPGVLDTADAPLAAVISESFAKRRLPGLNPIGRRLRIPPGEGPWFTIVGVVADVKQTSLDLNPGDAVYMTAAQWTRFADRARWLVVRARQDAAQLTPSVRRAISSVDKNQSIARIATMDDRLKTSAARRSFALRLFQTFAVVALVLAAIGTYSLLSGSVAERTREIGVRSALGASRRSILALVLRQGMMLGGIGIVTGMAGAMITSRALVTLLFGVSRLDLATYLGVLLLLSGVTAIACGIPAWRAARISPSVALRSE